MGKLCVEGLIEYGKRGEREKWRLNCSYIVNSVCNVLRMEKKEEEEEIFVMEKKRRVLMLLNGLLKNGIELDVMSESMKICKKMKNEMGRGLKV